MVDRPIQHQIAAKAVAKVSEIWTSAGAAVEEVKQDYGEDLLVQTCLNGKMDAARIWVQVKGMQTTDKMDHPGRRIGIRVRADLALRWARTADLLVLVLWDVNRDFGWYSIPHLSELHSELAEKDRRKISLYIKSEDLFNLNSAEVIAWRARLEHLSRFVRNFRVLETETDSFDPGPGKSLWAHQAITEAVTDALLDLEMINYSSQDKQQFVVSPEFWELFTGAIKRNEPKPGLTIISYVDQMLLLCILGWVDRKAGIGISHSLLKEMSYFMDAFCGLDRLRLSLE